MAYAIEIGESCYLRFVQTASWKLTLLSPWPERSPASHAFFEILDDLLGDELSQLFVGRQRCQLLN